jgi:hypothetical protein
LHFFEEAVFTFLAQTPSVELSSGAIKSTPSALSNASGLSAQYESSEAEEQSFWNT